MAIPLLAAAAAPLIGGLISGGFGLSQKKEGKNILKNLQYPTETLPDEYGQAKSLAEQMSTQGMPSEQYNQAMRNIQRQQLAALRYANDRRGGLAVLPQILQSTNDATLNLDATNAAARTANQRNLISYNTTLGGVKRDIFDKNVRQKYMMDRDYGMSVMGAGNQNFIAGLDKLATGGLILAGGKKQDNTY